MHTLSHGDSFPSIPHHEAVVSLLYFLFGPLLYLYVKSLTSSLLHLQRKDLIHFLPFAVFFLTSLPFYIASIGSDKPVLLFKIIPDLVVAHIIIYMILSVRILYKHSQKIKESYSSIDKINLNWLRFLVSVMIFLWLAASLADLIPSIPKDWNYEWLLIAVLMYVIGYAGLKQPEIFTGKPIDENNDEKIPKKKYEKSTLTQEMTVKYLIKLNSLMKDEKPYLKSNLTLPELADKLSVPVHHLSQIINEQFNQNFFEFISNYRIEEAKELIHRPDKQNINLANIAFESGFNSISSFNAAFKKIVKMTPSQFRNGKSNQ